MALKGSTQRNTSIRIHPQKRIKIDTRPSAEISSAYIFIFVMEKNVENLRRRIIHGFSFTTEPSQEKT